ncbi:response regulator [Azonexus sp.]|uniref:response regulator n=1 Tax=Azonexus sp. TaxID=1872668 RepID=UPI0027BAC103|nr:response regulator [Azonexus sp.]
MAILTNYSNKSVLILDDMPEMRSSLRAQLSSLGCEKVTVSGNVKDALQHFTTTRFDVILCDYYLAGGTDGQQFLEYLRTRNIIGRGVVFIMITAEKNYESVVTAAECLPDDYLLKPFTAEVLKMRMERLLEKKDRLARVDQLQDKGDWNGVIASCNDILAAKDRYMVDVMRIKGNALLFAGQGAEAVEFYRQALTLRPMPWARLGLARAQQQQGDIKGSIETLEALIGDEPRLMAAYDLLGKLHLASGHTETALSILENAQTISPNSLARHRAIATVAEKKGDYARVEQALDQVVKKTRNSPLRETRDIAQLGKALTEIGESAKAVTLLEEARTNFKSDANDPLLAAVEAIAQHQAGNPEKAEAALARSMQGDVSKLPADIAMTIAKACLNTGKQTEAQSILKNLVQNNPESTGLHEEISSVLRDNGAGALSENLIKESIGEIIQLNNAAVLRAKAGELSIAAEMLTDAANRLPGNMQVVSNAAAALLFDVFNNGVDADKLRQAQSFQQAVQVQAPTHPKLAEIAELMNRIRQKYSAGKK